MNTYRKLKQNYEQQVYNYSNWKTRAKIKTEKYLKTKWHALRLGVAKQINERDLKNKFLRLPFDALDVAVTGLVIAYILNQTNNWLRWGLLAAITQYYIGWLIDKIKEKKTKVIVKNDLADK
jgi:hypothetical protein